MADEEKLYDYGYLWSGAIVASENAETYETIDALTSSSQDLDVIDDDDFDSFAEAVSDHAFHAITPASHTTSDHEFLSRNTAQVNQTYDHDAFDKNEASSDLGLSH